MDTVIEIIKGWEILEEWTSRVKAKPTSKRSVTFSKVVRVRCPECKEVGIRHKRNLNLNKRCQKCHIKSAIPYGNVPRAYFVMCQRNAKDRDLEFSITLEYISKIFEKQKELCVYSGRKLKFVINIGENRKYQTASLDRIDSTKGYVEGNVQWIHKNLQYMKVNTPHEEFIQWCHEISNHQRYMDYQAC